MSKTGYLIGAPFTVADVNVAVVIFCARNASELFERYPSVAKCYAKVMARPRVQGESWTEITTAVYRLETDQGLAWEAH